MMEIPPEAESGQNYRLRFLPQSLQQHISRSLPDELWHYTSIHAMHAILESGIMHATDARFLNDREELIHAEKCADTLIRDQKYPSPVINFVRQHVARIFDVFLSDRNPYRVYVTCFTSRRDDLSQWRAYSSGSAGACIGFNFQTFQLNGWLTPCIYNDDQKMKILNEIFQELFELGTSLFEKDAELLVLPGTNLRNELKSKFPSVELDVRVSALRLMKPISEILPLFKHSSFESEDEWRITKLASDSIGPPISTRRDLVFYRPRKDAIVPYIAVPILNNQNTSLIGVILGPGCHPNAVDALQRSLDSKSLDVRISASLIPYRTSG